MIIAFATWIVVEKHATVIGATLLWLVARAAYGVAYSSGDASKRIVPFIVSFLAQNLVYGQLVLFVFRQVIPGVL